VRDAIIASVAGWAPGDEIGVFALSRATLLDFTRGVIVYQIDFAIADQLRIDT
jgi:hypothetical protein